VSYFFYFLTKHLCRKDWKTTNYRADGRIMVDCGNFQRFNPNYRIFFIIFPTSALLCYIYYRFYFFDFPTALNKTRNHGGEPGMTTLQQSQLYMCAPTVRVLLHPASFFFPSSIYLMLARAFLFMPRNGERSISQTSHLLFSMIGLSSS